MRAPVLHTPRTVLRPFARRDASVLLRLFRDPDVRRYLLDDKVVDAGWLREEVASSAARFARDGDGLWSVWLRDAGPLAGLVGFRPFFDPPRRQLVYALAPTYWGRGLATEVAAGVCQHAFDVLGFDAVEAAVDLPNQASIRVLERLGMTPTGTTDDGAAGTAFFALHRPPPRASPAP